MGYRLRRGTLLVSLDGHEGREDVVRRAGGLEREELMGWYETYRYTGSDTLDEPVSVTIVRPSILSVAVQLIDEDGSGVRCEI